MSTTEATWDLYIHNNNSGSNDKSSNNNNASPRSLTVFPAAASDTSLSRSEQQQHQHTVALLFGTDRGSLHYRCFHNRRGGGTPALRASGLGHSPTLAVPSSSRRSSSSSHHHNTSGNSSGHAALPLGVGGNRDAPMRGSSSSSSNNNNNNNNPNTTIPRTWFPVDLTASQCLPGPVVSTLWIPPSLMLLNTFEPSPSQPHRPSSSSSSTPLPRVFLVLVDDPRGSSASGGAYGAYWVTLQHGSFQVWNNHPTTSNTLGKQPPQPSRYNNNNNNNLNPTALPRLSAMTTAFGRTYVAAGRYTWTVRAPVHTLCQDVLGQSPLQGWMNNNNNNNHHPHTSNTSHQRSKLPRLQFPPWPGPIRPNALCVVAGGYVAIAGVGHALYAAAGVVVSDASGPDDDDDDDDHNNHDDDDAELTSDAAAVVQNLDLHRDAQLRQLDHNHNNNDNKPTKCLKLVHWTQSSQVHPVVALDLQDPSLDVDWSCLFLANGRECAVVDLYYGPTANLGHPTATTTASIPPTLATSHKPTRNGIVTTASPILSAAASWPFVTILMSDGLVSVRSPSCLAVNLRTIEVGTRPNDFFTLRPVVPPAPVGLGGTASQQQQQQQQQLSLPWIVGISYGAEAKVLQCRPDAAQDLADRFMRLSIDAFGQGAFPRHDVARAVGATFTATSYVGPEASPAAKLLLQQYLQAVLGLCDWESGASSGWCTSLGVTTTTSSNNGGGGGGSSSSISLGDGMLGASPTGTSGFGGRMSQQQQHTTLEAADGQGGGFQGKWTSEQHEKDSKQLERLFASVLTAEQPSALLTSTALLCLVATMSQLSASALVRRAAKACAAKLGVVLLENVDQAAMAVGQQVTEELLKQASSNNNGSFSLSGNNTTSMMSPSSQQQSASSPGMSRNRPAQMSTDYIEAAIWLLRSCGQHERAMEVAAERLQQNPAPLPGSNNSNTILTTVSSDSSGEGIVATAAPSSRSSAGQWSRIKYESYTATHLSELWCCGQDEARELVLKSSAAFALLESNPRLGLSVFTALHPQNESQWRTLHPRDDPFRSTQDVVRVLQLLKSVRPKISTRSTRGNGDEEDAQNQTLPLESGRALAVTFLESATGLSTGRPVDGASGPDSEQQRGVFESISLPNSPQDEAHEEDLANFHDELALLLLEGIISERSDDDSGKDTELGMVYRSKLRSYLRWPLAKLRPERFLESLPSSFLPEKALVLGRLGKHEDALRILYRDLKSLDLALEYCDDRYDRQQSKIYKQPRQKYSSTGMFDDKELMEMPSDPDNAYLPLVRVALESDNTSKGCAAAIQVLSLRRSAIDRAAALRLLPADIPVSAVARPFLIPALVDSESQVRRLTVVSALLRARYLRLKEQLTSAQLKAQANLQVVPQLQSLNLGDSPLHSTQPFRARSSSGSSNSSSILPEVWIVKHFFARHLVIQARVTNQAALSEKAGRTLTDICFVVAESSEDEAIQPLLQVPIAVLPTGMTGCTWCVLSAAPGRMESSTAQLTCELRYTVSGQGDIMALNPQGGALIGRTFVEELQDLEVHASHFQ